MLCGLLKPTGGEAHVVGLDLRHATGAAKGQLGYMAQKFSLYGLLSVRQNLEFSAGVYGLEGAMKRARIDEMIETFDRSEEHTSELQSLMRISYAVFCLKKKHKASRHSHNTIYK